MTTVRFSVFCVVPFPRNAPADEPTRHRGQSALKARQLLHFKELRINEVASQLGIDDPFYCSRLFKKQMGVSPVEYRKSEGVRREL